MKHVFVYAAFIAVLVSSCANNKKENLMASNDELKTITKQTMQAGMAADTTATPTNAENAPLVPQSGKPNIPDWDKKIIKTAHVTLELKDYNAYNSNMHAKVKNYGAYIAQEQQNETSEQIANEIAIKVPVDKFEDMMNSLAGEGIKVIEKTITTEDVTGEVIDTKARMEAKKQVRDRYLELLKQAKTMKDILEVQQEINTIQEDIEAGAGRVNYLVHSSAYSTINIKYYQYLNGVPAKETEPTFLNKIGEAFKAGGGIITNIILFVVSIWPLALAVTFLVLFLRARNKRKTAETLGSKGTNM